MAADDIDGPPTLAAFDVDGTLAASDTFLPFAAQVAGRARLVAAFASSRSELFGVGRPGARDRLKRILVRRLFADEPIERIERLGRDYAEQLQRCGLRPDVLARLRWHQGRGHRVALVSASLGVYLQPLGRLLGVDHVLCTELAVDGVAFTGELAGPNCRGPVKVSRLRSVLAPGEALWAYGNDAGDRELLALARHPVRVGRRVRLAPLTDEALGGRA